MAKAIMIQGTTSNAGKSLLTGGLLRILRQDGLKVAPFKSQNMALNSFVTADGLELGRAQAMQAECAGIPPDVRMNPILLKPNSDTGSQVIVMGEVLGNMKAADYFAYKQQLIPTIQEAYRSLAAENDVIVLEGAGSPAEINLKEGDIVNMGMARMAGSPVLLVGDINPGGVFAALAGTMQLMEPWERDLLKGVLINKFRGDPEILRPGLRMLEGIVERPVLGVVPWMELDIDDEDSLSHRLVHRRREDAPIDIAVIRLPRMSNFTDFAPLEAEACVSLRYVGAPDELGVPDLILLPGTKNTMGDLGWLRQSGLERLLLTHVEAGGPLMGICGGYQMLGETLEDPHGVEHGGSMAGLGLLRMHTRFTPDKRRTLTKGRFCGLPGLFAGLSGIPFSGYEIHMGLTDIREQPLCETGHGQDGGVSGNVCGCYIHGLFDAPGVAAALVGALLRRKGMTDYKPKSTDYFGYKQQQYDLLADNLRRSLDMKKIYDIIEEGIR